MTQKQNEKGQFQELFCFYLQVDVKPNKNNCIKAKIRKIGKKKKTIVRLTSASTIVGL